MYFNTKNFKEIVSLWPAAIREPWMGGLILGIQGNFKEEPDPIFTTLKSAWGWEVRTLFDVIAKPLVLLIVLTCNLLGIAVKLGIMLCLFIPMMLLAITTSIRFGLPDYPQTWISE
jgi:hypothetical protein